MSSATFVPLQTLEELRAERAVRRKTGRLYKSRLDKYAYEILQLRKEGASAAEVQFWLKQQRICVVLSTVTRWLAKHE